MEEVPAQQHHVHLELRFGGWVCMRGGVCGCWCDLRGMRGSIVHRTPLYVRPPATISTHTPDTKPLGVWSFRTLPYTPDQTPPRPTHLPTPPPTCLARMKISSSAANESFPRTGSRSCFGVCVSFMSSLVGGVMRGDGSGAQKAQRAGGRAVWGRERSGRSGMKGH